MRATVALVVAAGRGYADFIAGLLIGVAVGFVLAPAVRSWLAWREWAEASRQVRLTDEVLARMEQEVGVPEAPLTRRDRWPAQP